MWRAQLSALCIRCWFRVSLPSAAVLALWVVPSVATDGKPKAPRYEDYLVEHVYAGRVAMPLLSGGDVDEIIDERCRSMPADYYQHKRVNFAGHYVMDVCTCGSGCHYLYMWDAMTGRVFSVAPVGILLIGPFDAGPGMPPVTFQGERYRPDSSLMIIDACLGEGCDCGSSYWRWDGHAFGLLLATPARRVPRRCAK